MHFIYDRSRGRSIEWHVTFPIVCTGIDHDALHRHRRIVTLLPCRFATVVLRNNRGASIWVDEDFVRIEAQSTSRIQWTFNSISVELPSFHIRHEYMPIVICSVG